MEIWLILDTCTVRNHLHNGPHVPDLPVLGSYQPPLRTCLADTAAVELALQILEHRLPFEDWRNHVGSLAAVLDRQLPICPGGNELGTAAALLTGPPAFSERNTEVFSQSLWALMRDAQTPNDLEKPIMMPDESGQLRPWQISLASLQSVAREERDRWIRLINHYKQRYDGTSPSHDQVLRDLLSDFKPREDEVSNFGEKTYAFRRVVGEFIWMAIQSRTPYDPATDDRRGDVFDADLLLKLSLPSIICTADRRLYNLVQQARLPQAGRVIDIQELNQALRSATLHRLVEA